MGSAAGAGPIGLTDARPVARAAGWSPGRAAPHLEHGRRHGWLPGLPASPTIYQEDYPTVDKAVPRFVPEFVMTQLEATANLDLERLDNLTIRPP